MNNSDIDPAILRRATAYGIPFRMATGGQGSLLGRDVHQPLPTQPNTAAGLPPRRTFPVTAPSVHSEGLRSFCETYRKTEHLCKVVSANIDAEREEIQEYRKDLAKFSQQCAKSKTEFDDHLAKFSQQCAKSKTEFDDHLAEFKQQCQQRIDKIKEGIEDLRAGDLQFNAAISEIEAQLNSLRERVRQLELDQENIFEETSAKHVESKGYKISTIALFIFSTICVLHFLVKPNIISNPTQSL